MDDDGDYYTDYSINSWFYEYFDDIEEFAGLNMDRLKTKVSDTCIGIVTGTGCLS